MSSFLTIILDGLAFGMLLFIISVGMTVTMGIMKVINLAHGGFAMAGGYVGISLLDQGMPFFGAVLMAALSAGLLGLALEPLLFRRIYAKGELSQLLMTFGLTFIFISVLSFLLGAAIKPLYLPPSLSGSMDLGFRQYPKYRLFIIACGAGIGLLVWLLIHRSRFGLSLRAAVDNPEMAQAVGINRQRLLTITFALGCALAGLGALIGAAMLPLEPFYALRYLVYFLLVVAVGGKGSLAGSLLAAILIGMIDTMGKYLFSTYSSYMMFGAIFIILLFKPEGLMPQKV